MTAYKIKKIYY